MIEEQIRPSEIINIKILLIKNLRGLKGDVVSSTVKVEFRDKVLGESPKAECSLEEPAVFNYNTQYSCSFDDFTILDEISYRPVILTVTEILPKEKKQKEEKSQILGQCSFDLLPLLRGQNKFNLSLLINPVSGSPLEQLPSEIPQPTIDIEISCENALIPEDKLPLNNLITITAESVYSPPDSFAPNVTGPIYVAAFSLPLNAEKDNIIVFPGGTVKPGGEKDLQSKQIKWINPGSAMNNSIYIPNSVTSTDDYDAEDGDLKDKASRQHRITSEKEKPRVLWNMERRSVLQPNSMKQFQARIAKYRKWPVEIFRIGGSSLNKGRKDEENAVNFHGYAFVNLSPLLFPGVKRIRGAYKIVAYNESECFEMTGRNVGIVDEAVRITNNLLHQNTASVGGKKGIDKKPEKKAPANKPPVVASSSMGQVTAQDPNISESTDPIVNVEGHQYEEFESYITLEIKLDRPLVEKRKPEEVAAKVSAYIPHRDPLSKKINSADKAVEDYHTQVANITKQLLAEFRTMFANELTNTDILNSQEAMEQMRQELIYDLNSSGKYFAFKEQLKYAIIKIVREKCLRTSTITDPVELQEFLRNLFVYLVDELQEGIRKVITLKDTKPSPTIEISTDQLLHFAREAEINEDHIWVDRYYKERIAKDRNNPQFWFDYGVYLMAHKSLLDSEHSFKECISLSPQHLNGLVMYGIVCLLQNRLEEAETFFEAASTYHPDSIFAWTCLALFYSSIDKEIQYEMAIQEANKLNNPRKKISKPKPDLMDSITSNFNQVTERSNETLEDNNAMLNSSTQDLQAVTEQISNEIVSTNEEETVLPKADGTNLHRKESVQSIQKSQGNKINNLPASKSSQLLKVINSSLSKNQSSSKDSDLKVESESEFDNKSIDDLKSIFMKTAEILIELKSYKFVEKALAQELINQNTIKNMISQDIFNNLRAQYHLILAKMHLGMGAYEEAEANLLETVQITFDKADAWAQFGHLKFIVGDEQAAESCFSRALNLVDDIPEPHPVYMRLASIYLIQDKYIEAKQAFLLACKNNPTCLSWLGVGISCYRLNDLEESEEALAEANILNNENAEVWGYLSLICLKSSRKLEAEQSYKYALKVGLADQSTTLLEEILNLQNEVGFGNPEI